MALEVNIDHLQSVWRMSGVDIKFVIDIDGNPWFCGKHIQQLLGYGRMDNMFRRISNDRWRKSLKELVSPQVGRTMSYHDMQARFISEEAFYELILASHKEEAIPFKEWVCGHVLPIIRRTGSYAIPTQPPATRLSSREQQRVDSIFAARAQAETAKLTLVDARPTVKPPAVYAQLNDMVNVAALNITCTTSEFKRRRNIPNAMSIASVCPTEKLGDIVCLRTILIKRIRRDSERLRAMSESDFSAWFMRTRAWLRETAKQCGFHDDTVDLELLSVEQARQAERELRAKRTAESIGPSSLVAILPNCPTVDE
jgi:prophage antirepressor-like protein